MGELKLTAAQYIDQRILENAERMGLKLSRRGDKLRIESPKGKPPQHIIEGLRSSKWRILAALRRREITNARP